MLSAEFEQPRTLAVYLTIHKAIGLFIPDVLHNLRHRDEPHVQNHGFFFVKGVVAYCSFSP